MSDSYALAAEDIFSYAKTDTVRNTLISIEDILRKNETTDAKRKEILTKLEDILRDVKQDTVRKEILTTK